MRRVVITGTGVVSPIGNTLPDSWESLKSSQSGIRSYTNDPVLLNQTSYNLALIRDFQYSKYKVPHASSRMNSFAHSAVQEALLRSGLNLQEENRERLGICMGVMSSNTSKLAEYASQSLKEQYRNINRLSMLQILSNTTVGSLNVKYQALGPSLTVSTACASGLSAVLEGYKWIRLGEADIAITGGAQDVYNPLCLNSSLRLQAMTSRAYDSPSQASRPFDRDRSGFVLGQGSGALILEEYEHAKNRKANILAQIIGYGCTSDGYHLVRPKQTGQSQIRAMQLAIKMGSIQASNVDLVNVHATSTKAGDQIEANSIKSVFKDHTPFISAFKGSIGHTFGAAGAIQLALALQSMKNSIIPKNMNLVNPDVEGLNYVVNCIDNQQINYMIKNSFGFGGINVSMLFKKYQG